MAPTTERIIDLLPADVRRWVRAGAFFTLVGYGAALAVGSMMWRTPLARVGEVLVVALATVAILLTDRGRVRLAGGLVVAGVWLEIHISLIWDGLGGAWGITVLPALTTLAALYLGRRIGILAGLSTGVSLPLVTVLNHMVEGRPLAPDTFELSTWIMLPIICGATGGLVGLGLSSLGRAVRAAQASEARFSSLIGRLPDAVLSVDAAGAIHTANPAARALFGVQKLEGRSLTEIRTLDGRSLATHLDHVESEGGESSRLTLDLPIATRTVEVRSRELGEGTGAHLLIFRDLTELKLLEDRLVQIGSIIEEAWQELYVVAANSGRIRLLSRGAREALGFPPAGAAPVLIEEVNPSLDEDGMRAALADFAGPDAPPLRAIHRRRDGSVYPVEVRLRRTVLDGEPVVVLFAVDVTTQMESEQRQEALRSQLEHAQRMDAIGHLAGGVAHDFNNLLTVMGGYADALREEVADDAIELVDGMMDAQERGARLTRRLLAFARKEVVQPEILDLSALVRDVESLASRLVRPPAELVLDPGESVSVLLDRSQFEQVLLNLVTNARDAHPENRVRIMVRARSLERDGVAFAALEVEDDGSGMDEVTRGRIFDPFFTTKAREKGTGLGLSTVHAIVEQSGGRVEVETELGRGSIFRILWPVSPDRQRGGDADDPPALLAGPARILVVEDDEQGRMLMVRMLGREGHEVRAAADGVAALEILSEDIEGFDLVISDVVMPRLSGFDLADRIESEWPGLAILLVSGYLDGDLSRAHGLGSGRDLLLKPFRPDEFLRRVRRLLTVTEASGSLR